MLEQTEAQVQGSRLGITTQERTTKPAPVNSLTSSQLETVPETEPPNGDIFLAKNRIGSDTASSSPRRTGTDISGKGIDVLREQKTLVSQTQPHSANNAPLPSVSNQFAGSSAHDAVVSDKPPTQMPTSNPRASSATIPESIPMKPSVNQGLSDIRIYFAQRKDTEIRIIPKIEDIPGKHVIVYNPDTDEYAVMKKHDINYKEGILMFLPHGDGWKYRTLTGDVNLWKSLRFKVNLKRCFGMIRVMFLKGSYPSNMLLKETPPVE
ncbi:hypothetical protein V2W45_1232240 [Cenococcum geophilum]